jgi:hypothetical protein
MSIVVSTAGAFVSAIANMRYSFLRRIIRNSGELDLSVRAKRAAAAILVIEEARKAGVPPAFITAHIKHHKSNVARKAVQRRMHRELGMPRYQIAEAFQRSLRRVRASVLGD